MSSVSVVSQFLDALLPRTCPGCDEALTAPELCRLCARQLPETLWPLAMAVQGVESARVWAPYDGPAGAALRRGKYQNDERAVRAIAAVFCRALPPLPSGALGVVPVPQASWTTLQRGYSPVWVIARAAARSWGVPCVRALRRRSGRRQAQQRASERGHLRGAFEIVLTGRLPEEVVLVDDVITTGATAEACAGALLQEGVRRVSLVTLTSPLL